jgi:hypothetical protein
VTRDSCPRLNDQPPVKKGTGKKPAAAPFGASKPAKVAKNPLFEARQKNFSIGINPFLILSPFSPNDVDVQVKIFNRNVTLRAL